MKDFEILEHTADGKFKAYGSSLEEVFENAMKAMTHITTQQKIHPKKKKFFKIKAKDLLELLYLFLEKFIIFLDVENFIIGKAKTRIKKSKKNEEYKLEAEVYGDDAEKYKCSEEIKAVTYNEMKIEKKDRRYEATVVVDL